jgi:large conductance mechanosensitive channel
VGPGVRCSGPSGARTEEASTLKGFRQFILRGNVVDLAVAFVIGVAFGAVVAAFVTNVITPIIGSIFGSTDFSSLRIHLRGENYITYGALLNAILVFVSVAAAVYFFVVVPMNRMAARRTRQEEPTTRPCPFCTTEIALTASRCRACTSQIPQAAPPPSAPASPQP